MISSLRQAGDTARSIGVQFVLNFFFAWMVIYLPLLLAKEIGFSWDKIGFIFTIMLLPFLLFELPAGILGDRKLGEKELLVFGFVVMFISTLAIPLLSVPAFWSWALLLFV
jgi:MFS family permease